jgi:hypothetical protein
MLKNGSKLTVSAWLYRGFDITNALYCHAILVVTVNELIFKFANLIYQDSEFVGHVRDILIAGLPPKRKLLLGTQSVSVFTLLGCGFEAKGAYSNFHPLSSD